MAAEQEKNIKFVQEVEKNAFLYNYNLPEYMRKNIIDKTWAEIGKKFEITGPEAKEKWKNLRSVFVRHLKPPKSGSAKRKPYYLACYMQFAIPFIKTVAIQSGNLEETTPFADDSNILHPQSPEFCEVTEFEENVTLNTQSISTINDKKRRKSEETEAEEDISAYLKKKQSKLKKKCGSTANSNKMFLLSLLPDMNRMNDSQRRQFKRRILEVMDEIIDQTGGTAKSGTTLLSAPSPMSTDREISATMKIYYESMPSTKTEGNED